MSSTRSTRVAVVQLDYHPAAIYDRRDLIEDPRGDIHDSLEVPDALLAEHRALRDRIRETYLEALIPKLRAIIEACARWKVDLLVFPEYSIPWQALHALAEQTTAAAEMTVVAGTHAVNLPAQESGIYERLGWPLEHRPMVGTAVAPVLRNGRLVQLVGKLSASQVEEDGQVFKPSQSWETVPLVLDGTEMGPFAVLICIDFLHREDSSHWDLVAQPLRDARLIAVPSLTPWHTKEEFVARARVDARRYKRPVLLANIASSGGSTIFIDSDAPQAPRRTFPGDVAQLAKGEEGIVIADIDLGYCRPGSSTAYEATRSVRPFAAASLVHRHDTALDDYAAWAQEFSTRLDHDAFDLRSVRAELERAQPQLMRIAELSGSPTRSKRLRRLFHDLDNISDHEDIRRFTREIVLPEEVLPLAWLQRGLAQGAKDVVASWRRTHDSGLEQTEHRLGDFLRNNRPADTLRPPAEQALGRIITSVRGSGIDESREWDDTRQQLDTTIKILGAQLNVEGDEIDRALEAGHVQEIEAKLRHRLASATEVLNASTRKDEKILTTNLSRLHLQLARVLMEQQRLVDAKETLEDIDADALDPSQRSQLARAWAAVEEPQRARSVLDAIHEDAQPPDLAITLARISIAEGKVPSPPLDDASILLSAGWLQLSRGLIADAVRLAMDALEKRPDARFAIGPFVLLTQAFSVTVSDVDWVQTPIAVENRAPVIERIEQLRRDWLETWVQRVESPNMAVLSNKLLAAIVAYQEAIAEVDPWPELGTLAQEPAARYRTIIQLAERGDIDEAMELFEPVHHPWITELRHAHLLMVAGRIDAARAASQALVSSYPERGPVERLAAAIFYEASDYDRALQHARCAYAQVPAGGYRYLLAKCMIACGKHEDAWTLLEPVWSTAGPRVQELAAKVADWLRLKDAPSLWAHYVERHGGGPRARLQWARALFHANERDRAAEQAWKAFEAWASDGDSRERMTPTMLGLIGRLQLRPPSPTRKAKERVERIIEGLRERFPDRAEAEQVCIQLALAIGRDTPINIPLLVEAGIAHPIPGNELPRVLQRIEHSQAERWRLYAEGGISLAGLARAQEQSFASLFVELWNDPSRYFCAPSPTEEGSLWLEGLEILVGPMELLLLAKLELLEPLEQLEQRGGMKLLVFDRTIEELREQRLAMLPSAGVDAEIERLSESVHDWLTSYRVDAHVRVADPPELPPLHEKVWESLGRAPLQERLELAGAIHAQPDRRRALAIDFFGTHGIGNVELGRAFQWSSPRAYQEVNDFLWRARSAFVSVPALVRAMAREGVLSDAQRHDIGLRLAQQGFGDALDPADLIAVTRMGSSSAARILAGLEALATHGGSAAVLGRLALARHYADAIVVGGLGEQHDDLGESASNASVPLPSRGIRPLPVEARIALVSTLLARLELLYAAGGDALDMALMFISLHIVDRPRDAFLPAPGDASVVQLDKTSLTGQLWLALGTWAGEDGSRRAALDRATCSAWVSLDRMCPQDGPGPGHWSLLLSQSKRHGDDSLPIDRECVAILSANWKSRPLSSFGVSLELKEYREGSQGTEPTIVSIDVPWERVLEYAARAIDLSAPAGDGRTIPVDYEEDELSLPYRFYAPVDAVVLRMPASRLPDGITTLIATQGPHDGIAYEHLKQLQQHPDDEEVRRSYARYTAGAPWRRVRDDPAYLMRWIHEVEASGDAPSRLGPLCRMLYEPDAPIEESRASEVGKARWARAWQPLEERVSQSLVVRTATMPGFLGLLPPPDFEDSNDVISAIQHAVDRLEQADAYPAGWLAHDIRFLSVAATRVSTVDLVGGTVNLRELLPTIFIRAFERLESPTKAMGRHEEALIRICGQVIGHALQHQPGRSFRDHLWLTYRLHAWLTEQLELVDPETREHGITRLASLAARESSSERALATVQLFDPFRFRAHGFEYRKAVLLSALIAGLSLARQEDGADPRLAFTNAALERRMLEIAGHTVPEAPELGESWIDWPLPIAVPDLAAYWLSSTNPQRFFSTDPEHLIRRIERWPNEIGPMRAGERALVEIMTRGLAFSLDTLSERVARVFTERLLSLADDAEGRRIQWMGLSSAFARGAPELEARVRNLVEEHLDQEHAAVFVGFFLSGVIGTHAEQLMVEVDGLLTHGADDSSVRGTVRTTVITGLARIVVHAPQPERARHARKALDALARRPELCDDEGLKALLDHLPDHATP